MLSGLWESLVFGDGDCVIPRVDVLICSWEDACGWKQAADY